MQTVKNFILIDDDPICNLLSAKLIQKTFPGSVVDKFTQPETGLGFMEQKFKIAGGDEAVLLLDINMPVLSGWDVLDELAHFPDAAKRQMIIYILSSSVSNQDKEKATHYPFLSGYWVKPLTILLLQGIAMETVH